MSDKLTNVGGSFYIINNEFETVYINLGIHTMYGVSTVRLAEVLATVLKLEREHKRVQGDVRDRSESEGHPSDT